MASCITLKILANLSAWLLPAIGSVALRRILPVPRSRTPRTSTLTSRRLPSVVVVPNQKWSKSWGFSRKKHFLHSIWFMDHTMWNFSNLNLIVLINLFVTSKIEFSNSPILQFSNSRILEFKVLHKRQRAFKTPF